MLLQPHLPLESDAYLQVLMDYNKAMRDCLAFTIIGSAEDYDKACERLVAGDWPPLAADTARRYRTTFPELVHLFTIGPPLRPQSKTVWEEVRGDLFEHPHYHRLVRIRSKPYQLKLQRSGMQMKNLYDECLPRVIRQIIGRAVVWPVSLGGYRAEHPKSKFTWLEYALNGSRKEVDRALREYLGEPIGDVSVEDRPKTKQLDTDMPSRELDPAEQAICREQLERVQDVLKQMSAQERELVAMKMEDRTFVEIGQVLGWSAATASYQYYKALKKLLRLMQDSSKPGSVV